MSKNSTDIYIRLDGGNGATYFFNTATFVRYCKSIQFYRAVSWQGWLRKIALVFAYLFFRRKSTLSGNSVASIISETLEVDGVFPLPDNASALISPTRDKAVINLHDGRFVKYASKMSYCGVANELEIYRVLNDSEPTGFTVAAAKEICDTGKTIAFEMSCRGGIERDEPELKQLVKPLAEFFRCGKKATVQWRELFDGLKQNEFCDGELVKLLPASPVGEVPTGLCHRDFKVWNVKMYDKPHFFDFESATTCGVPGEDLFNYVVDPLLNFYDVSKAVLRLRRSDLPEAVESYFSALGVPAENIELCWVYYLAERVIFWRRQGNEALAGKFLQLLSLGKTPFTTGNSAWRIVFDILVICLAALAVRIGYLSLHPMESRDGILYTNFVRQWFLLGDAAIPDYTRIPPPLYCYTSRLLMYFGITAEIATILVSMVSGVLLFIPLYFAGRIFWGRRGAFWCGILGTVFPPLVRFSCSRLREGVYYLFVFSAFAFFFYAAKRIRPALNYALCGAMCVLAIFSRYEAFELLLVVPAGIMLCSFFSEKSLKSTLVNLLSFGAAVVLTSLLLNYLPGMPDIITIFWNRIYLQCLGTFINPV